MRALFRNFFVVLLIIPSVTSIAQDLRVTDLTCNYITNPIAIDENPSFTWKLESSARGQDQAAYQIIISSSNDFKNVLWNSGKINSSQSKHIRYKGKPLAAATRYFWKVKVWDNAKNESAFSETAFLETAPEFEKSVAQWISGSSLFDAQKLNEHRYRMISGARKNDYLEPLPLLRKQFASEKEISKARLYISGLGFYEAFINGQKVSDQVLSPAFTNYDKTVLYDVHDVTTLIKRGDNAIGVMLGNGWYNSSAKEVWGFDHAPWRADPTVRCELVITFTDATTQSIITDASWLSMPGPVTFSNLWQGEYYDARLEVSRWSEAGIDETKWKPARRVAGPIGFLRPRQLPPVKVMKAFAPVKTTSLPNGNLMVDFGQNIAGFAKLTVRGKAGSRIQLKFAEKIKPSGEVDQSNISNLLADSLFQVDRYILKGDGEETWSPRFIYHGFRYAEISFSDPKPELVDISAQAVHTSFETKGKFSCSDEIANRIQSSTLWSFRNNFVGFPTDCPQREKNGWTGDAQLACETGLTNFEMITSYKKWLNDLRDEQQPDGSLPGIVPTGGWGYYWGNGPAWDIACVVIPWSMYQYTGDSMIIKENYSMMKKYVDYMTSRSPGYIADFGLGDWIPVETETPVGLSSTGYFYYGANVLSAAAALVGKMDEQKLYTDLAAKIRDAFNTKYFNSKAMTYANGSQTALSCALFHKLVPQKHKKAIQKKLVQAVHARNDHVDTGILGARYLPHALTDAGYADLAYKVITNKTYPGWGYWIEQGATTLWEDWKGESSLNHIMLGDVSSWFYKTLAGIRLPDGKAGFSEFVVDPVIIDNLTEANGSYNSPQGMIESSWKLSGDTFNHHLVIPPNSSANYFPPVRNLALINEDGKPLTKGQFVILEKDGRKYFRLKSGVYDFQMQRSK